MHRELRIIAPVSANPGRVKRLLLDAFGGYTVTRGTGLWRAPDGEVHQDTIDVYDVAVDVDYDYRPNVQKVVDALKAAGEQCVYVRWPNGRVEFI